MFIRENRVETYTYVEMSADCVTTSTVQLAGIITIDKDGARKITEKEWAISEIKDQPFF